MSKQNKPAAAPLAGRTACVVGAGVAGLYTALRLAELGCDVHVYERNKRIGGRWKTLQDASPASSSVVVEAGAWRVSYQRHPKTMRLLQELGIQTTPIQFQHEAFVHTDSNTNRVAAPPPFHRCPDRSGLSIRDNRVWERSKADADAADERSGYPGQDKGSCTVKEVYGARTGAAASEHELESGGYCYPNKGFSHVVQVLQKACEKRSKRFHFYPEHKIRGANTANVVVGWKRRAHDAAYEGFKSRPHDWIVWCVPPRCLPDCDRDCNFHLLKASTMHAPLVHVYAPLPKGTNIPTFKIRSDTPLCQCIHHRPDSGWWQPAYASGTHASYWYRLYQHDRQRFLEELQKHVGQVLGKSKLGPSHVDALVRGLRASEPTVRVCFWEHAIHMWEPVWHASDGERLRFAVQPNPYLRPRVLVAGEAFSLNQGWAEGSLHTADMAVARILAAAQKLGGSRPRTKHPSKRQMVYRGLSFAVPPLWPEKHPGGRQAIEKYYGEDVTHLWDATHRENRKSMQHLFAFLAASNCPSKPQV